jgi:sulfhydrogenase subunit beta (sulfur reductase)
MQMVFDVAGLDRLVGALTERFDEVLGPRLVDGVIVLDEIASAEDLPTGWTDDQSPGRYRTGARDDRARFGWAVGPHGPKAVLHPPREQVWSIDRQGPGLQVRMHSAPRRTRALVGIRPCELAAVSKLDRVLTGGPHPDPGYSVRRDGTALVVVECGTPAPTCFCSSMGTGPAVPRTEERPGFDLLLTEIVTGPTDDDVRYLAEPGSDLGDDLLAAIGARSATDADTAAARAVTDDASDRITRRLDTERIRERLLDRLGGSSWDEVAERCLACGNCTAVCPTCFCTDLVDTTDLAGTTSERWRVWDSCFSLEYSHLGDGPHRSSVASRYRQWLTHKLATWHDQFGESGCVGCGRCMTWCPVGIELTEEAR